MAVRPATAASISTMTPSSSPSSPLRATRHQKNDGPRGSVVTITTTETTFEPNEGHPKFARPRMNSRDIPRSYSGLYGNTDNLIPFELARKEHTDWIEQGGWLLLATYLGGIALIQVLAVLALEVEGPYRWTSNILLQDDTSASSFALSWTIVHVLHCAITFLYLHWCKGSPLYDVQNELAGLTLWEQLEGRPHTSVTKRTLTVIPTLLCYAACHFGQYHRTICFINVAILWTIEVVAKLPMMNGVRILGINRTTGIDDEMAGSANGNNKSNKSAESEPVTAETRKTQ